MKRCAAVNALVRTVERGKLINSALRASCAATEASSGPSAEQQTTRFMTTTSAGSTECGSASRSCTRNFVLPAMPTSWASRAAKGAYPCTSSMTSPERPPRLSSSAWIAPTPPPISRTLSAWFLTAVGNASTMADSSAPSPVRRYSSMSSRAVDSDPNISSHGSARQQDAMARL